MTGTDLRAAIGVDFDNTIVCYDDVLRETALGQGLITPDVPANKEAIRNSLRAAGREQDWTRLQGYLYGEGIGLCSPFPGALDFFRRCRKEGRRAFIISHKTLYPFLGPKRNLHEAAQKWLSSAGFYETGDTGLSPGNVYFVPTKEEKLGLIRTCGVGHFIDDLPELLKDGGFPAGINRILFDPHNSAGPAPDYSRASSWQQITELIFGR